MAFVFASNVSERVVLCVLCSMFEANLHTHTHTHTDGVFIFVPFTSFELDGMDDNGGVGKRGN